MVRSLSRNSLVNENKSKQLIANVVGSISQLFGNGEREVLPQNSNADLDNKIQQQPFHIKSGIHSSSIFIDKSGCNSNQLSEFGSSVCMNREQSKTDLNETTLPLPQTGIQIEKKTDLFEKNLNLEFIKNNNNNNNNSTIIRSSKPVEIGKTKSFFEPSEFKRIKNNMSKISCGAETIMTNKQHFSAESSSDSEKSKSNTKSSMSIETIKNNNNSNHRTSSRVRINLLEIARAESKLQYNKLYNKIKTTREQFANNKLKNVNLKY